MQGKIAMSVRNPSAPPRTHPYIRAQALAQRTTKLNYFNNNATTMEHDLDARAELRRIKKVC